MSRPWSVRSEYERLGVERYYREQGARYRNPHETRIRSALHETLARWPLDRKSRVLDLACGSGEVSLVLRELGFQSIEAIDPFTAEAYRARTGQPARRLSFEQIAQGGLESERFDAVVCSFALHLIERTRLPQVAYRLSSVTAAFLVLSPHKRPVLDERWGFRLEEELYVERIRVRRYESLWSSR